MLPAAAQIAAGAPFAWWQAERATAAGAQAAAVRTAPMLPEPFPASVVHDRREEGSGWCAKGRHARGMLRQIGTCRRGATMWQFSSRRQVQNAMKVLVFAESAAPRHRRRQDRREFVHALQQHQRQRLIYAAFAFTALFLPRWSLPPQTRAGAKLAAPRVAEKAVSEMLARSNRIQPHAGAERGERRECQFAATRRLPAPLLQRQA